MKWEYVNSKQIIYNGETLDLLSEYSEDELSNIIKNGGSVKLIDGKNFSFKKAGGTAQTTEAKLYKLVEPNLTRNGQLLRWSANDDRDGLSNANFKFTETETSTDPINEIELTTNPKTFFVLGLYIQTTNNNINSRFILGYELEAKLENNSPILTIKRQFYLDTNIAGSNKNLDISNYKFTDMLINANVAPPIVLQNQIDFIFDPEKTISYFEKTENGIKYDEDQRILIYDENENAIKYEIANAPLIRNKEYQTNYIATLGTGTNAVTNADTGISTSANFIDIFSYFFSPNGKEYLRKNRDNLEIAFLVGDRRSVIRPRRIQWTPYFSMNDLLTNTIILGTLDSGQIYNFRAQINAALDIAITDGHAGQPNSYGALFAISKRHKL